MHPPPPALDDVPSTPSSLSSPNDFSDSLIGEFTQDDISRIQVLLKDRSMHDHFELDRVADHLSWGPNIHPSIVDPTDPDPSRYSLLIHEVSLLVGLAPDDRYPSSEDSHSLVSTRSKATPDVLPHILAPTKSLTFHKHGNTGLPHSADTDNHVRPSVSPKIPTIDHNPAGTAAPFARHGIAGSVRPLPPLTRRQGQVFHFGSPLSDVPLRSAVDLDETFIHPREPPPKPTSESPADRSSSLDRLEQSLLKLEAHAPRNHRKSQSEERAPHYVADWKAKRPSLPPPRRLRKEQSNHEIAHRNPSRPAHAYHLADSPPVPRLISHHQNIAPNICPVVPHHEDRTPGSFMDMDISRAEEKRQTSFRQLTRKEKVKSFVRAAKTASREVMSWGKFLTGSPKSSVTAHETSTIRNPRA